LVDLILLWTGRPVAQRDWSMRVRDNFTLIIYAEIAHYCAFLYQPIFDLSCLGGSPTFCDIGSGNCSLYSQLINSQGLTGIISDDL
jgi:hypothetical protein